MSIDGTSAVGKDPGATTKAHRVEFDQAVKLAKLTDAPRKPATRSTEKNAPAQSLGAAKGTKSQARPPVPARGPRVPLPVKAPSREPDVETIKVGIKTKIGEHAARGDMEMAGIHARVFINLATR